MKDKGFKVYVPCFPIGHDYQNYESWKRVLKAYYDCGLIHNDTVIFAHSIAPVFICKFLIEFNIKVKRLVFVCGFNNYVGINEDYDFVNKPMFVENVARIKKLCGDIVCFYTDNDPYLPFEVEKSFADEVADRQLVIKNGGHLNSEFGYTKFNELLKYI